MLGPPAQRVNLLLIEDDPVFQRFVTSLVAPATDGFSFVTAPSVSEALPLLASQRVDAVLLDLNLPDAAGFDALERVRKSRPDLPVVILTGARPDHGSAVRAVAMGAQDYIVKNQIDRDRLVRAVRYALERQRVLATLEGTLRELEQANRDLREFAGVVGHDLKAPLRGIGMIVDDLLAKPETDAATRDAMQRIHDRLDLMRRLIDGIHNYSRAGQEVTPPEEVDAGEVVRHALQLVAPPPSFRVEVEPDLPRLRTNATQLEQVFQNLIGNAVRHHPGPQGRIRVGWKSLGKEVAFFVEDDGPGLPPGLLERLFRRDRPLIAAGARAGLGLAIVEKLVHLNGGELTVRSSAATGSRFEFTWPREPARVPEVPLA